MFGKRSTLQKTTNKNTVEIFSRQSKTFTLFVDIKSGSAADVPVIWNMEDIKNV